MTRPTVTRPPVDQTVDRRTQRRQRQQDLSRTHLLDAAEEIFGSRGFALATLKEIGAALRDDPKYRDGILSDFSYWGIDQVDGATLVLSGQMQCTDSTRWSVQREFNRRIAETFRERGIRIANPQRSVVAYADGSRPVVEEANGSSGDNGQAAEASARPPSPADPARKPD